MKRSLLIAAAFTILGILPSQAVNIADLENARGYAYLYLSLIHISEPTRH